jgi:hypothetical protein
MAYCKVLFRNFPGRSDESHERRQYTFQAELRYWKYWKLHCYFTYDLALNEVRSQWYARLIQSRVTKWCANLLFNLQDYVTYSGVNIIMVLYKTVLKQSCFAYFSTTEIKGEDNFFPCASIIKRHAVNKSVTAVIDLLVVFHYSVYFQQISSIYMPLGSSNLFTQDLFRKVVYTRFVE